MDLKQLRKKHPHVPLHFLKKALEDNYASTLGAEDRLFDIALKEAMKKSGENTNFKVYGVFENESSITIVKIGVASEWLAKNKIMHAVANTFARKCYLIPNNKDQIVVLNVDLAYWIMVFNQNIKIESMYLFHRKDYEVLGVYNLCNQFVGVAKLGVFNSTLNNKYELRELASTLAKNAIMYYGDYINTYCVIDENHPKCADTIHPLSPEFKYYLLTRPLVDFDKQFETQIKVNDYFYLVQNDWRKIDGWYNFKLRIEDISCFVDSRYLNS